MLVESGVYVAELQVGCETGLADSSSDKSLREAIG